MTGRIIEAVAGVYYIKFEDEVIEASARGLFRLKGIKPLVGDFVEFNKEGDSYQIKEIKARKNELLRPNVSNIDAVFIVSSFKEPSLSTLLLDKFLIMAQYYKVRPTILFSKSDIYYDDNIINIYKSIGYDVFKISIFDESFNIVNELIKDKTAAFAGPSGVGKSSLLNKLLRSTDIKTQAISKKLNRGKQTTRSSKIYQVYKNSYILDTPGFTELKTEFLTDERELKKYYFEFKSYENSCKFMNCMHINEPECGIKKAVDRGDISSIRYNNYLSIYKKIVEDRRY